jgi:dTDP-4-dehydrorhamnose reductase
MPTESMKILLTGASSYVGARLYFDLSKTFDVIGTYNDTPLSDKFIHLDITDEIQIKNVVSEHKPDIIIHAAANANARWCEANPDAAIALNQTSTKHIVDAANEISAKVIYLSSFAVLNPDNIYGKTKLQSEAFTKETKAGWVILRPSLIIGFSPNTKNDRPFNRILKNLDEKTEAIYDTGWKFQPTYLHHISQVITEIINRNTVNETIAIATPDLKSRYDIARDILSPFGITVTPIDKKDTLPIQKDELQKLSELQLPFYTYEQMTESIVEEIKNRTQFSFAV